MLGARDGMPVTSSEPVFVSARLVAVPLPSLLMLLPVFVRVTLPPLKVSRPTLVSAALCETGPFASRSSASPPRSKAPATLIALAMMPGAALPGWVTAPMRMVPAVMPVRSVSDSPPAAPNVMVPAVRGASSNTPVPALATPAAPAVPRLFSASVCSPIRPPFTDNVPVSVKVSVPACRKILPDGSDSVAAMTRFLPAALARSKSVAGAGDRESADGADGVGVAHQRHRAGGAAGALQRVGEQGAGAGLADPRGR